MNSEISSRYPQSGERLLCIDRARGILVFCMIFFQIAVKLGNLGVVSRIGDHGASGLTLFPGFALADVGEPLFLLLIALCFLPSFSNRLARDGRRAAYLHFTVRFSAIMGLGFSIRIVELIFGGYPYTGAVVSFPFVALALLLAVIGLVAGFCRAQKLSRAANRLMTLTLALLGVADFVLSVFDTTALFTPGADTFAWWNVLASIGCAGLFLLFFAESDTAHRGIAAGVMLLFFTVFHQLPGMMRGIDEDIQGGVMGVIGWAGMLLAFSVMADLFYRDRAARAAGGRAYGYLWGLAVLAVLGVAGALLFPVNKGSVSPGYIFPSMAMAAALFFAVALFGERASAFPLFVWWGKSPVFMYFLQYLLMDIAFSVVDPLNHLPVWGSLLYLAGVTALITWLSRWVAVKRGAWKF